MVSYFSTLSNTNSVESIHGTPKWLMKNTNIKDFLFFNQIFFFLMQRVSGEGPEPCGDLSVHTS